MPPTVADRISHNRERFLSLIDRTGPNGCWLWRGRFFRSGYGVFYQAGKYRKTNRVAWEIFVGPIPAGLHVLHHCDNPSCVNPAHLWLGTHSDNMADKVAKGRQARCGNRTMRARTHCPQGHPYQGDNLIVYRNMRYCRQCQRNHKRAYKAKKKSQSQTS